MEILKFPMLFSHPPSQLLFMHLPQPYKQTHIWVKLLTWKFIRPITVCAYVKYVIYLDQKRGCAIHIRIICAPSCPSVLNLFMVERLESLLSPLLHIGGNVRLHNSSKNSQPPPERLYGQ